MEQYLSYLTQSDLYWASLFIIQVRHTSSGRQQKIVPTRHHLDTQYYSLMTFTKAWTRLFIVIRPTGPWAFYGGVSYFQTPFIFTARWIYEWSLHSGYL